MVPGDVIEKIGTLLDDTLEHVERICPGTTPLIEKGKKPMRKQVSVAGGMFLLTMISLFIFSSLAEAIPAFARKYETSCATCHAGFPKLTPFGEAFRMNGFQYLSGDGEMVKDEPVSLGADAYKRVWPDAVWPGAIPGNIPLSFRAKTGFTYEPHEIPEITTFQPPTLQIISGGTLGEDVSFFVGAHLFEKGELGSIDRLYLKLDNMLTPVLPDKTLYFRIGQFIPEVVPFASNHRGLTITPYAFNTYDLSLGGNFASEHVHGAGPFGIEGFQIGAEASGIIAGRNRYVLGLVNGSGTLVDNNHAKDGYFRLAHKFGGMDYTGEWPENIQPFGGTGKNWFEKAFTIGIFGYNGARENTANVGQQDLQFYRIGSDFDLALGNLNTYGGYIYGNDERIVNGAQIRQSYSLYFAEGNYFVYPWLVGVLRYEQAIPEDFEPIRQVVPGITVLYRANIKWVLEAPVNPETGELEQVMLGLDFGF